VDPDPRSQNVADPTDPDPKHCLLELNIIAMKLILEFNPLNEV